MTHAVNTQHPKRLAILRLLKRYPKMTRKEIAKQVGLSETSVYWHLRNLTADGEIEREDLRRYRHVGANSANRQTVLRLLKENPLMGTRELVERSGISETSIYRHIHALTAAGLIERPDQRGRHWLGKQRKVNEAEQHVTRRPGYGVGFVVKPTSEKGKKEEAALQARIKAIADADEARRARVAQGQVDR